MRLVIGSDHAGFELKEAVEKHLVAAGFAVEDLGPHNEDSVDYPTYAFAVASAVASCADTLGILVCGSGIGMSIAANKVPGIRAALVSDIQNATLARLHNNANVLCMGGRMIAADRACQMVDAWLNTEFEGRHQRRIDLITAQEKGSH